VDSGHVAGDGGSVYYETAWTDHSGPAVVLTHDGLLHRETWDAQFTTFAHHYRVARWDRRGYGRSPAPQAPYSSVDDLARVVRAVSDAPATLIGCSFGSLVSLHCALDHPQLVSALVLVGPIVSGLGYSEHFLTRGGRRPPALDAPVAEQLEYWTKTDPWIVAAGNDTAWRARVHHSGPTTVTTGSYRCRYPDRGSTRRADALPVADPPGPSGARTAPGRESLRRLVRR
jgi:pimeloyl-ACP methyl ester carboxylesterase